MPTAPDSDEAAQMAIFRKLYPAEFLRRHLDEHVREDGRALDEARAASLATGVLSHAEGSALVRLGRGTMVTAAVRARVCAPHYDRLDEGFLVPSIDLSPLCSPQHKVGPPGDEAQGMVHQLQTFLNTSGLLPRVSLCLQRGVAVWALYVDIVCVSADGSVLDAAALAAVAALRDTRLPVPVAVRDPKQCVFDAERTIPLTLTCTPVLSTWGIYEAAYLLADMTAFEQSLTAGNLCIGLVEESEKDDGVFYLRQTGTCAASHSTPLSNGELLERCIELAKQRANILRNLLEQPAQ